jgi:N-dimethylarginine dimethylaminohydrolase
MSAHFLVSPPPHSACSKPEVRRQWDRFTETLACTGDVSLREVQAHNDAPGIVFIANGAFVVGRLAIISSFRKPEQRFEQAAYRAALTQAGLATTYLRQTYFEGAADTMFDRVRPICYAGYGWCTERSATIQLQEIVGCRVLPLMLVDERFVHLNTALCPLASGHVLVFKDAFSPRAQTLLRSTIEAQYLVEVGAEDAVGFACNAVEIGDALVLHQVSHGLRSRLNDIGYRVFSVELDEFVKIGGSAKNLALQLDDGPAPVLPATRSSPAWVPPRRG